MPLTSAEAESVLTALDRVYKGAQDAVRSRWYTYGSNEPEASLGALNIAYNASAKSLISQEYDAVAGNVDSERWLELATLAENSLRDIAQYTEGDTVLAGLKYVATESGKELPSVAGKIAEGIGSIVKGVLTGIVKGLGATILLPLALLALIAALILYFLHRESTKL